MADFNLQIADLTFEGEFYDTPMARAIYDHMPLSGTARVGTDEIYFDESFTLLPKADRASVLRSGELAIWSEKSSITILLDNKRADELNGYEANQHLYSFGKILGDISPLKNIGEGEFIYLTRT